MMKKLIIFTLMFLFLFSMVSAVRVDYSPNDKGVKDMNVNLTDTIFFDLIKTKHLGTMELKSHKEVGQIKTYNAGKQVTMFYEFNMNQLFKGGLGEVEFINMRNNKTIDRDYKFVYLDGEIKERDVCVKYDSPNFESLEDSKMTQEQIEDYILNYESTCLEYEKE